MRVKLFTLRYSATLGGFDETPLSEFSRDKELIGFREHFFAVNDVPHLVCVLTWQDAVVEPEDRASAREVPRKEPARASRGSREGVLADLDERERVLFNSLREWRSAKAHEEGVPPYLVFTNRHLVELVRRRPDSPTALGHVSGIGPGKIQRYGAEVLGVLHGRAPASSGAAGPPSPTPTSPAPDTTDTVAEASSAAPAGQPGPTDEPPASVPPASEAGQPASETKAPA